MLFCNAHCFHFQNLFQIFATSKLCFFTLGWWETDLCVELQQCASNAPAAPTSPRSALAPNRRAPPAAPTISRREPQRGRPEAERLKLRPKLKNTRASRGKCEAAGDCDMRWAITLGAATPPRGSRGSAEQHQWTNNAQNPT